MDLGFLTEYAVFVVMGICLCTGYVIKTSLDFIANKYIPLIMLFLGAAINVWMNPVVTPEVILGGMFSGLASTGLHQALRI